MEIFPYTLMLINIGINFLFSSINLNEYKEIIIGRIARSALLLLTHILP